MSRITVNAEQRKVLLQTWSAITIRRALRGETQSHTAALIRKKALELGGLELR